MVKIPEISVIMGIYNQKDKRRLAHSIDSILCQSFTNFEFIIYEDGSDEETKKWLRAYADRDARIRIIGNDTNHGLAYSLNCCIVIAKGKYLARMDDDDISLPARFQMQYDFLEKNKEYAFVGCSAQLMDDSGVWGLRVMAQKPREKDFLRFSPYIHPTVMIRKDIFKEDKNLYSDARDNLRCEDYELFMRLWKKGYKGYNLQEPLLIYREDKDAYRKRKLTYRIAELKLRYRSFKDLDMLFPWGWLYVLRPLIAAMVPAEIILRTKKIYHRILKRRLLQYQRNLKNAPKLYKAAERTDGNNIANDSFHMVGIYVLAPVIYCFVLWVLQEAGKTGKKRLYFLARDGYLMYKTASLICQAKNIEIECRYLYCSRYSLRNAERGILEGEICQYLRNEGLADDISYGIVDSGWMGSLQKSLENILKNMGICNRVEGYYFGLYQLPPNVSVEDYHAWFFFTQGNLKRKVRFNNNLFECICSAPQGMTVGYQNAKPVLYEEESPNRERINAFEKILADYTRKVLIEDISCEEINQYKEMLALNICLFMGKPTKEEARCFGGYLFCADAATILAISLFLFFLFT